MDRAAAEAVAASGQRITGCSGSRWCAATDLEHYTDREHGLCAQLMGLRLHVLNAARRYDDSIAVPTDDLFIQPVLRYLATHPEGISAQQANEAAADALGNSDEDQQKLPPRGAQLIDKNRADWAHHNLNRSGSSSRSRRGTCDTWQITPTGIDFLASHPEAFSPQASTELAMGYIGIKLRPQPENGSSSEHAPIDLPNPASTVASSDDRLGEARRERRQTAESELLEPGPMRNLSQ